MTGPQNNVFSRSDYRADIDGLRALAVLGVVAFHSGLPGFSGGFVGVDVFFVISGYLITGLLNAELERSSTVSLSGFFVRRIRRLMPALVIVVLATLLISMWSMFPLEAHRLGKSAQAVALLIANIHFKNFSGGYFDPTTDVMPLLHTWSLAVEEQYYIVWPPLLLLLYRFHGRNVSRGFQRNLVAFLALASVASFAACVWQTRHDQPAAFYLMPYRAWEFALGALVSHWKPALEKRLGSTSGNLLTATGLLLILGTMHFLDDSFRFPGVVAFFPVVGSAMVIAGGIPSTSYLSHRILAHKLPVSIGLISYSLYLWHWPLLALERDYFLGRRDPVHDGIAIALAFILAAMSYRFIEQPIRERRPGPFANKRGSLRVGFLMSLLVISAANGVMDWSKHANAELVARALGTDVASFGAGEQEQRKDGNTTAWSSNYSAGNLSAITRLAVWGDSHADQLRALMNAESRQLGIQTQFRISGACPPLLGAIPFKRDEGRFQCGHFNEKTAAEFIEMKTSGLRGVILSARWNSYLDLPVTEPGGTYPYGLALNWHSLEKADVGNIYVGTSPLDTNGSIHAMEISLRNSLATLTSAGLRVLVVAPVPELYFSGPQCLYKHSSETCTVPRTKVEQRRGHALQVLRKVTKEFASVKLWDPIEAFCDSTTCYAERNGMSLYNDDNHISGKMSFTLREKMDAQLRWAAGLD